MGMTSFDKLQSALADRTATVGIIGLGYVGLPLAAATARRGFATTGFDVDPAKEAQIKAGRYLTWRSREFGISTRFIELAGEINTAMPNHVVDVLARALDERLKLAVSAGRVLVIGLAYKKNIADVRESPSFKLMSLLEARGAKVDFHDPHVTEAPNTREHAEYAGRRSKDLSADTLKDFDAVLISTDHDAVDYGLLATAKLVVDTRNAMAKHGVGGPNVVKA
jgi:UDP-N-acetyl-D-glucosamine dehydrogenase